MVGPTLQPYIPSLPFPVSSTRRALLVAGPARRQLPALCAPRRACWGGVPAMVGAASFEAGSGLGRTVGGEAPLII